MSRGRTTASAWPRSVAVALALLALVLKGLTPTGFMVDDRAAARGFALVICTGQGPVSLADLDHRGAPPAKSKPDAPCAFAGHAAAPGPAEANPVLGDHTESAAIAVAILRDLLPGRGLAAPPPPSVGPPALA